MSMPPSEMQNYTRILEEELIPAMGCTEPIAIAYAAAKAKSYLPENVESYEVRCSGNIIKMSKASRFLIPAVKRGFLPQLR